MAKKKNKKQNQKTEVEVIDSASAVDVAEEPTVDKGASDGQRPREIKAKDKKLKSNKKVKKTVFSSLGEKVKGTYSELKKVEWPSFSKVVKQTGVVLAFVVIFVVILIGFNSLFGWLFELFTNATL